MTKLKTKTQIEVRDGEVIFHGPPCPPFEFINHDTWLLDSLTTEPHQPHSMVNLLRMAPSEVKPIEAYCAKHDDLRGPWAILAMQYSPITKGNDGWNPMDFPPIYERAINSGFIDTIVVTKHGHRFIKLNGELMTFAEFQHAYGIDVEAHLEEFIRDHAEVVRGVFKEATSPVVSQVVTVVYDDGRIGNVTLYGLEAVPVEDWVPPEGAKIIAADIDSHQKVSGFNA